MKIAKALIENYRHIERLELNFTDGSDTIRNLSLLGGANASGKTTVLDALAAALGPVSEFPSTRPGFLLTKPTIVCKGADFAKVTIDLRFSDDEVAATRELYKLAGDEVNVPDVREIKLTWVYPDPENRSSYGSATSNVEGGLYLLKGRVKVAKLLPSKKVGWDWFRRTGGIFTFDQQRTGSGKTIRQDLWNVIRAAAAAENDEPMPSLKRGTDPHTLLLSLALNSQRPLPDMPNLNEFKVIQEQYANICEPRTLLGAIRDEFGTFDLRFHSSKYEYGYDGIGSGEEMVLLFLVRLAGEHVHRSIVFIDELELHQQPAWQEALVRQLPLVGDDNQIIATTQSPHMQKFVPEGAFTELPSTTR